MIDAGGDLVLGDAPPGREGWRIVIATFDGSRAASEKPGFSPPNKRPRVLELANCGVATSGDLYQFLEIDGVRYSHIVDPRTGLGLTERTNVTVIAPNGTVADALASGISVLGPDRGGRLARERKGVHALVRSVEGDEVRATATCGFPEAARATEAAPR